MGLKEKNEFARYVVQQIGSLKNACTDIKMGYPVYHYTSPEGLMGILRKRKLVLWFSHADYLNDMSEGKDILTQYQAVCKELRDKKQISDHIYQFLNRIEPARDRVGYDKKRGCYQLSPEKKDTYICCFSWDKDSLPMWNYYTKGSRYQGYNIGLRFLSLESRSTDPALRAPEIYSVIYEEDKKQAILRTLIETLTDCYQSAQEDLLGNDGGYIRAWISQFLLAYRYVFKNNAFRHENEMRMVVQLPRYSDREVKFRAKEGLLIPYIEVEFHPLVFSEVTIGPLLEASTAKATLSRFLETQGYARPGGRERIFQSSIPIRY